MANYPAHFAAISPAKKTLTETQQEVLIIVGPRFVLLIVNLRPDF